MKKLYLFLSLSLIISAKGFAQLTLHTDTIIQTSTCAGGNVIVPFTVTGGSYNFSNVFTAQLSNNLGQFTNPVNIGTLHWWTSGIILATIPANTNFGFLYRIRVIASNPADTGSQSPNTLIVTQVAQLNQVIATPHNYVCPGDTLTLYALNPAVSYSWSTGDTTASIQVTQPGVYSVTTVDFLTCQSTAYDTLYSSCTAVTDPQLEESFHLFPNPADGKFSIRLGTDKMNDSKISIVDPLGKTVFLLDTELGMNRETEIDISSLAPGIYFVAIDLPGNRITRKLVIE